MIMKTINKMLLSGIFAVVFICLTGNAGLSSEKKIRLTVEEANYLKAHPEIIVSNEFDWPPFDFTISGKPTGFGIDLMNILAGRIGIRFNYINGYTWEELVDMFYSGKIDVIHSLSRTPEREKKALFSNPYYHSKNVLISRSDVTDINTLEDLSERIIALPSGWSSIGFFKKYFPAIHIVEVSSSRQALEYVDQGKVSATIEQEGIANYFIKKFGFHDLKLSRWIDNDILQQTSSMHFAVLKKNRILFRILSKAHKSVTPEEIAALEYKWLSRKGRQIGKEDVGLTPEEQYYLNKKGEIRYSAVLDRLPFEATRGANPFGMLADFSEIFSERLNIPFVLVKSSGIQDSIRKLQYGQCDIIPMLKGTPDERKIMDFSSSYLSDTIAIIAREKLPFISGLEDMSGKKIGIVNDDSMAGMLNKKYPDVNYIQMKKVKEALFQLSSGEIDAVLMSVAIATHNIRRLGLTNLKVAGYTKLRGGYRIGVIKENRILHSIMSKLVRSMPGSEIDEVYRKWVTLKFQHQVDYSELWKYGGAAIGIILFILLWTLKLASLNRQLASSHKKLKKQSVALKHLSITDSLTGLFNRRHLEKTVEKELERVKRYKTNFSAIILDIDDFKSVNDKYGHQRGDDVLVRLSLLLQQKTRATDITGRWGGEEFVIICPETNKNNAIRLSEFLRSRIRQLVFDDALTITASFGVSSWNPEDTIDSLVSRADEALYRAKNTGRDKVVAL